MASEVFLARESAVNPINATGKERSRRVTAKVIDGIRDTLNGSTRHDKHTEDLSYSRGTVTAYTIEKGYGDRPAYTTEYTQKPDREKIGRGWTGRDSYAESVFNAFERKGIKVRKLVHHGQYD